MNTWAACISSKSYALFRSVARPCITDRFVASIASGALAMILRAQLFASSSSLSAGTTAFTMPMRNAFCASIASQSNSTSMAHGNGIWRGSRTVVPPPGNNPRLGSKMPNDAFSDAIRMSVPISISMPPATHVPLTAAITGFHSSKLRSTAVRPTSGPTFFPSSMSLCICSVLPATAGTNDLRSAPTVKSLPVPVMIATRASSSSRNSSHAAARSAMCGRSSALRRSGRLIVIVVIPSSLTTSMATFVLSPEARLCSSHRGSLSRGSEKPGGNDGGQIDRRHRDGRRIDGRRAREDHGVRARDPRREPRVLPGDRRTGAADIHDGGCALAVGERWRRREARGPRARPASRSSRGAGVRVPR